ncbi:hypothetical protein HKD37_14G040742 [Glycine soja]
MSPHRVESSASRGLSLADRAASLSSYSTPIIFGWRKCLCDDKEVLVTSHSSKNPELLLWGCPNWKRVNNGTILCNHFHWADEIDGGIDEVFTEAMDEHKKRIMRMQIKLNSESKKGQMLSVDHIIVILSEHALAFSISLESRRTLLDINRASRNTFSIICDNRSMH